VAETACRVFVNLGAADEAVLNRVLEKIPLFKVYLKGIVK
jgi:hypothetical protein